MSRAPQPRIGQEPSRLRQAGIPIATVMAGSLLTLFPFVATAASLPSLGLCFLLAWRVLHRDLWPVWIALPLGLFDDLFSGQPLGSAMMLWTICFLILDVVDRRYIWRDFQEEWTLASLLILGVGIGGLVINHLSLIHI